MAKSGSKYLRKVTHLLIDGCLDVYIVLAAYKVTCPGRQHAIKKLLCAGLRGKGSQLQDLKEARDAIDRAIELQEAEEKESPPDSAVTKPAESQGYPAHILFNHWLIKTYVRHVGVGAQQTFDGLRQDQIELVQLMLAEMDQFSLVEHGVYQPAKKPGRSGLANFVLKNL